MKLKTYILPAFLGVLVGLLIVSFIVANTNSASAEGLVYDCSMTPTQQAQFWYNWCAAEWPQWECTMPGCYGDCVEHCLGAANQCGWTEEKTNDCSRMCFDMHYQRCNP